MPQKLKRLLSACREILEYSFNVSLFDHLDHDYNFQPVAYNNGYVY